MKKFISFEGVDGVGKTLISHLLTDMLREEGYDCILTREPGGVPISDRLRESLLAEEYSDPMTEFLLFNAARHAHVEQLIAPALSKGKFVITDRFFDSSIAYQGYMKHADKEVIKQIHELSIPISSPDLTILLDADVEIIQARIEKSAAHTGHYDNKPSEFKQKLREAYLDIAEHNLDRIVVIDAAGTPEKILSEVVKHVFEGR